ncbi:NUDIX domain-containing protein [Streptacidiphilus jiangxiensis]|uniref:8-oxo-dGTP diphosphatase n=1 Tax=Streptacidiphilus jiangxiensis TaxID=235985 RepID=A0A1H7PTG0_STRJI|nr:NUDIX hydrolase [Streptacidiphilus jiangxiensis]SEL38674.1 8-oxo-dGTP diphosphatase [Streptacidiphilus jiangxiensis]
MTRTTTRSDDPARPDPTELQALARRFPRLHAPQFWAWGGYDAQFAAVMPEDRLVTNVHLIGFAPLPDTPEGPGPGDGVVLCRDERDHWFLPGGTRERDESIDDCLARELREEAGARLLDAPVWIGAHRCVTDRPTPYRPWQPHPEKAWLWGWAEVVVDSAPTNPEDGESVVEVRVMPPQEAQELLTRGRDGWWAELVALAVESRGNAPRAGGRTPGA